MTTAFLPTLTIAGEQFDRLKCLALELAGIELVERHSELLSRRCRRLKINDPASLDALLDAAQEGDAAACQQLIGLLTTSFTEFFRNPWHFDIAAEHALWAIHRRGKARFWSAAAASGEEPYSLAMALIGLLGRDDPPVTILATDINSDAVAAARRGEYSEAALRKVEPCRRTHFFSEPAAGGRWRIAEAARRLVEVRQLNLASETWRVEGPFDVIFCRNVLMYMEAGRRRSALQRLAALISPGGLLILDPAEHPGNAGSLFGPGTKGVYARLRI